MIDGYEEILHLIKQAVQQQVGDYRPFVYGHVASYDPARHRVKVIVPTLRDENDVPVLSPWMPLGTLGVGAGYGIQVAPKGGATFENPTAGEQVIIKMLDPDTGTAMCAHLQFNEVMAPPFTDLKGGEVGIKQPSGSFLRMHENGDIEIACGPSGNYNLTKGDLRVTGAIIAGYGSGDQVGLLTHTHAQPDDSAGDGESETHAPTAGT